MSCQDTPWQIPEVYSVGQDQARVVDSRLEIWTCLRCGALDNYWSVLIDCLVLWGSCKVILFWDLQRDVLAASDSALYG